MPYVATSWHHEALAVVVVDGGEVDAEPGVTCQSERRIGGQEIDGAGLQRREVLNGIERNELGVTRVTQDRGRCGAADVHGKTRPLAVAIDLHEARCAGTDAADELTPSLDHIDKGASFRSVGHRHRGEGSNDQQLAGAKRLNSSNSRPKVLAPS